MSAQHTDAALPTLPRWGGGTLADLVGSAGALLGVGGLTDTVGLGGAGGAGGAGASERIVIVLVDGLGARLLDAVLAEETPVRVADRIPTLAAARAQPAALAPPELTCGAPSTTVTSLTSLSTGVGAAGHGLAGYSFFLPGHGVFCPLGWPRSVAPSEVQSRGLLWSRIGRAGVTVSAVQPARFEGSGLTVASMQCPVMLGIDDTRPLAERIPYVAQAATSAARTLTYVYASELDHAGHAHGWRSAEWAGVLVAIDAWLGGLRAALPTDVDLLVTGDHGMVDVEERWLLEAESPVVAAEAVVVAGEPRFRHVHLTDPARAEAVAAQVAEDLGERAWVRTRDQAVTEGWFGPPAAGLDARLAGRFGDVLVAARGTGVFFTRSRPENDLQGVHGSLTAAEMQVPLLRVAR